MSILIKKHNPVDNFVQISNYAARTDVISHKARGILVQLHSHVEGWVTSQKHLISASKEGRVAISSGLAELEEHGFLRREILRNEDGTIRGSRWHLTDDPINHPIQVQETPSAENLHVAKPTS